MSPFSPPFHGLHDHLVRSAPAFSAVRRDLHANPELCFEELRTSDVVARELTAMGIPVHRGLGKTGVVGTLQRGTSDRAIGLRADMDALPMGELNTFDHASRVPGRMHACGHDGHVAMLLAAARQLVDHGAFDGTVHFIFQPAEEGGGGAREMIRDGLFERFPVDAVFGMHNWPGGAVGRFAVSPGPVLASSSEFHITVRGQGCHAAMPHLGVDPVVIAAQLIQGFQSIISRNKKPVEAGVISVTMVQAGEVTNVVPNDCVLQGTVRTFSVEVLDLIEARMRQMTEQLCAAFGGSSVFVFERNYPPTINHAAEAAFAREVLEELVGKDHVDPQEPTMGAEDFAYMLLERPGCYIFVRNGEGDHREIGHGGGPCTLHNPSYDFNDALIPLGAAYWTRLVERWLA